MRYFISYSREDEKFIGKLYKSLRGVGVDAWLDTEEIRQGENWANEIQRGLDECQAMILVISPDSMNSHNVSDEWQYYLNERKLPIYPVLYRPAKKHFQVSTLQYVDFHNQNYEEAFSKLLQEIGFQGTAISSSPLPDESSSQISSSGANNRAIGMGLFVALVVVIIILFVVSQSGMFADNPATETPTDEASPTYTSTDRPSPTLISTHEFSPTATNTDSPTVTDTDSPTATDTDSPTATDTDSPTATNTDSPTATDIPITATPSSFCTHTVTEGQAISDIEALYQITREELLAANPQIEGIVIFLGQDYSIPDCTPLDLSQGTRFWFVPNVEVNIRTAPNLNDTTIVIRTIDREVDLEILAYYGTHYQDLWFLVRLPHTISSYRCGWVSNTVDKRIVESINETEVLSGQAISELSQIEVNANLEDCTFEISD